MAYIETDDPNAPPNDLAQYLIANLGLYLSTSYKL